jgi:GNAT superfamily N-acetyltransferase
MNYELLEISFDPSEKQLEEIREWLIEELDLTGHGFYCNWEHILSDFKDGKLIIISYAEKVIGFTTWYSINFRATIEIAEIKPEYRSQGIAKILFEHIFTFFVKNNIYVVDLECSPPSSEEIWKRLGFIDFPPQMQLTWKNKRLYKILIPTLNQATQHDKNESLELWDGEPGEIDDNDAICKWNLEYEVNTRRLVSPIIYPSVNEWKIKWKDNDSVFYDEKIKRFNSGQYYYRRFLIIEYMPTR